VVVVGRGGKNKSLFSLDDSSGNRSTTTWQEIKDHGLPDQTVGVVNLAGENVLNPLKRWNEEFRKSVYTSRIETTRVLAEAVLKAAVPPTAFVTMSGVGFYPPGNQPQDETSAGGEHDFIAKLALAWEEAAKLPAGCGSRSVSLRSGVVLGRNGGMIQQLLPAFYFGFGGRMGSGEQPLAWIHVKDLARLIIHCIENTKCEGVMNAVAPQSITNQEFVNQFARSLRRPAIFPTPEFIFDAVFGHERAAMITEGQVVKPVRTLSTGFTFNFPTVEDACMECAHLFYQDPDEKKEKMSLITKSFSLVKSLSDQAHCGLVIGLSSAAIPCLTLLPPAGLAAVNLSMMGTQLGTQAWVSFVAGPTMFMNMKRHAFGDLQARLFPKFGMVGISTGLLGVASYHLSHPAPDLMLALLVTSTITHFINSFALFPLATKFQYERRDAKEGSEEFKKVSKKFGITHGMSVSLAMLGIGINLLYFYHLGGKVAVTW